MEGMMVVWMIWSRSVSGVILGGFGNVPNLLEIFSGMLRKYLKKNKISGVLNSKLGVTLNDCEITSRILESIDGGDDGKGNMVIIR